MRKLLRSLTRDEDGVTAVEYCLIALIIIIAVIAASAGLGSNTCKPFQTAADKITSQVNSH
jgi:pilus assembly protein Flp/PilA